MEGVTKRHRFIRFTPSPARLAAKSPQSVLGYSSCRTDRRTIGVPAWDETAKRRTDLIGDDDPADDMGRPAGLRKLRKANFVARSGASDWRSGCESSETSVTGRLAGPYCAGSPYRDEIAEIAKTPRAIEPQGRTR